MFKTACSLYAIFNAVKKYISTYETSDNFKKICGIFCIHCVSLLIYTVTN